MGIVNSNYSLSTFVSLDRSTNLSHFFGFRLFGFSAFPRESCIDYGKEVYEDNVIAHTWFFNPNFHAVNFQPPVLGNLSVSPSSVCQASLTDEPWTALRNFLAAFTARLSIQATDFHNSW